MTPVDIAVALSISSLVLLLGIIVFGVSRSIVRERSSRKVLPGPKPVAVGFTKDPKVERMKSAGLDPLTRAGNRSSLLAAPLHAGSRLVVFDIEGFIRFNDSFGHSQGDLFMQGLASALTIAAGNNEWVFRPGGDEFVLVLPGPVYVSEVIDRLKATPIKPPSPSPDLTMPAVPLRYAVSEPLPEGRNVEDAWRVVDQKLWGEGSSGPKLTIAWHESMHPPTETQ